MVWCGGAAETRVWLSKEFLFETRGKPGQPVRSFICRGVKKAVTAAKAYGRRSQATCLCSMNPTNDLGRRNA